MIHSLDEQAQVTALQADKIRVRMVGENHCAIGPKNDFAAQLTGMKAQGFTDLVLELTQDAQPIIDDYIKGKKGFKDLVEMYRYNYPDISLAVPNFANANAQIIASAVAAGMRVHAIDVPAKQLDTDALRQLRHRADVWPEKIIKILKDNGPDAKVVSFSGVEHVSSERFENIPTVAEILRHKKVPVQSLVYAGGIKAGPESDPYILTCELSAKKIGYDQKRFLADGNQQADYILHLPQNEEVFETVFDRWMDVRERRLHSLANASRPAIAGRGPVHPPLAKHGDGKSPLIAAA